MIHLRSPLTAVLRRFARLLPVDSRLRRGLSAAWDRMLRLTGEHVAVPIAGRSVRLRIAYRHIDPDYEADTLKLWLRLVRVGDTVWDVGANLGVYSILTAQAVGPTGAVVAWEPAPRTYAILQEHLGANGVDGSCRAIQEAVAEKQGGTVRFSVLAGDEANTMNRIAGDGPGATVEVPVGTLDGWLDRLGRPPRLVKIDIEGAEVLALRGAARLLGVGGPRPVLLVAVHPRFLIELGCSTDDLPPLLERYQYECRDIRGEAARPTELAEYFFLPRERADDFVELLRTGSGR